MAKLRVTAVIEYPVDVQWYPPEVTNVQEARDADEKDFESGHFTLQDLLDDESVITSAVFEVVSE